MPNYPSKFDNPFEVNPELDYPFEMSDAEKNAFQKYMFDLNIYQGLVQYLNSTSEAIDPNTNEKKGYGKNEYGFEKDMDKEMTDLLKQKVFNLFKSSENLVNSLENSKPSNGKSKLIFEVNKTAKHCFRENSVLEELAPDEKISYKALHAKNNNVIIDVGSDELNKVGGALSSRCKIRYMDEQGKVKTGFFTEDNSILDFAEVYENTKKDNPNLEPFFNYLEDAYNYGPKYGDAEYIGFGNADDNILYNDYGDKDGFVDFVTNIENRNGIDLGSENITDEDFIAFKNIENKIVLAKINGNMKIEAGNTSNKRNIAMSNIATVLKMPNMLAKATPMTILKNGETVHGCFMENSDGISIDDATPSNPMFKDCDSIEINYDKTLKDVTNLMVLDFICLNGDRHQDNMFYKFEENPFTGTVQLAGIQGIDNDLSFGTIVPKENQSVKFIPPVTDIQFIKRETADAVMDITETKIKSALIGTGLNIDEINAAWQRTQIIQDRIKNNKIEIIDGAFDRSHWNKMEQVINDRDIDDPNSALDPVQNIKCLQDEFKYNFNNTYDFNRKRHEFTKKEREARIKNGLENLKNKIYIDEKMTIKNQSAQIKSLYSKLSKPGKTDTPEYVEMYELVKDLHETLTEYKKDKKGLTDDIKANDLKERFADVQESVEKYLMSGSFGSSKKDMKKKVLAEDLNEVCIDAINTHETKINELNTLMSRSFTELQKINNKCNRAEENSFEKVFLKSELDSKIYLSSFVGNLEKPKTADKKEIAKSFAQILVSNKLQDMKINNPDEYNYMKKEFDKNENIFDDMVNNVLKNKEFQKMMKHVSPVNAIANNTTKEMSELAEEMEIFKNTNIAIEAKHKPGPVMKPMGK